MDVSFARYAVVLVLIASPLACRSSNESVDAGTESSPAGNGGAGGAAGTAAGGIGGGSGTTNGLGGTNSHASGSGANAGAHAGTANAGAGGVAAAARAGAGATTDAAGIGGASGAAGSSGRSAAGASAGAGGIGGKDIVGARPPMGWNSWNTFGCNMDEALIKQIADTFTSSGMQAAGYEYVNLDDCWMDGRDSSGKLRWNASKFPSGIPALADYVHAKGLKLGIYETPNTVTCVGLYGGIDRSVAVGSLGHEKTDAETFAAWGVDYLKYDLCQGQRSGFAAMRDALRGTGRPIFYSINPGNGQNDLCPPDKCSLDLPTVANLWRIGFDIGADWGSVTRLIDANAGLASYAGPGHWNDPDMMEVGHGLNDTEGRAHFSMWAIMAAPLIAGNDLRSMSAATKTTLTNREVIDIDQDPMGVQGRLVASPGANLQVWSKTLAGENSRAVALFNRNGSGTAAITVQWSALGLPKRAAMVRDLWSHSDLGMFDDSYSAMSVPSHGVVMLKVTSVP